MMTVILILLTVLALVLVPCVIGHYVRAALSSFGSRTPPESLSRRS